MTNPTTPEAPFPADRHWKIAALWDYWIGVYRNVGRPPRRADIDPIDIPALLPNLWLADWDAQSARFRYRLVGTAVTKARNTDATGRFLDDDLPGLADSAFGRSLAAVVREGLPVWSCASPPPTRLPHDIARVERLSLPLAGAAAGAVAMVLNLSVCTMRDGTTL